VTFGTLNFRPRMSNRGTDRSSTPLEGWAPVFSARIRRIIQGKRPNQRGAFLGKRNWRDFFCIGKEGGIFEVPEAFVPLLEAPVSDCENLGPK